MFFFFFFFLLFLHNRWEQLLKKKKKKKNTALDKLDMQCPCLCLRLCSELRISLFISFRMGEGGWGPCTRTIGLAEGWTTRIDATLKELCSILFIIKTPKHQITFRCQKIAQTFKYKIKKMLNHQYITKHQI